MICVELPWPHKTLNPNSRPHPIAKSVAAKKARKAAWAITLAAGARHFGAPAAALAMTFYPPRNGRYDHDNLTARCKSYFDGIADALGIDDQHFRHAPIQRGAPVKNGLIKIEITEIRSEAA